MRSIAVKNEKTTFAKKLFILDLHGSITEMSDTYYTEVLDFGFVELIDSMASDLDVVNAAKVSFSAQKKEIDESCVGLINYLMKNKHATPFEHSIFKFRIKAPIFITREWMRHRWSSFNEMSMRYYQPEKLDYYTPAYNSIRKQIGKPGAYSFEEIEDPEVKDYFYSIFKNTVLEADTAYYKLIEAGIAKEIARCVLPVTQYTEFIWTVNARSLINFISLRNDSNAQYEINQYAIAVEDIFSKIMPISHSAFLESGRIAI
jgi:thymidylate synthase (FAD)